MFQSYKTINNYGKIEHLVEKSRFIAYVDRVETEEEAQQFIAHIKEKHKDATHNCSAYIVGDHDQYQKAHDDGEPSGTAGKPILEVIKKMKLKNTVIVVTRYFGGIKLGAGGLIRAYGQSAKKGILAAGVVERVLHSQFVVQYDYTWHGKIENELNQRGYLVADTQFTEQVTLTLLLKQEKEEELKQLLTNITKGNIIINKDEPLLVDLPIS